MTFVKTKDMDLRIPPINRPRSIITKLGYWYMKRLFGKVITVSTVIYSRFPSLMFLSKKIQDAERKMPLDPGFQLLIKTYVATLNGCPFCIDIAQRQAINKHIGLEKFGQLMDFETNDLFSEKEKIALKFSKEITCNITVGDDLYREVSTHWSDEEIIAISYITAIENYYNRLIKPIGIGSDDLCAIH